MAFLTLKLKTPVLSRTFSGHLARENSCGRRRERSAQGRPGGAVGTLSALSCVSHRFTLLRFQVLPFGSREGAPHALLCVASCTTCTSLPVTSSCLLWAPASSPPLCFLGSHRLCVVWERLAPLWAYIFSSVKRSIIIFIKTSRLLSSSPTLKSSGPSLPAYLM